MTRQANAVDFWRGFALVSIFVNHIPGIFYERLTHRNLSISDSAELFVFLAGWSLGLLVGSRKGQLTAARLASRLGGRALQIYAAWFADSLASPSSTVQISTTRVFFNSVELRGNVWATTLY
jgi:hypothetical protein